MQIFRPIFAIVSFLFVLGNAFALSDDEILQRFQLVPEPGCIKPKLRAPRMVNTPFFSERHYLTIDGGKECQILDVWVAPLTNLPNENRRNIESAFYRKKGKGWKREYGLAYVPAFRLMDSKTGRVYLYIKLDESPFYTDEIVYFSGSWEGYGKDSMFFDNIRRIGNCSGVDEEQCIEETRMVDRAVELFKRR